MKRLATCALAAMSLVAVLASSALAQQDGGRRGRGGFGGGFGGFGLGGLIAMPEVQKELGLSEADAKKLTDDLAALRPQRTGGGGDFRNLSQEERQKRFEEMRKQGEETAKKTEEKLKASLTDAQFKRLGELRLQREGANSLERSEVADKLKLTTEQKDKIKKIAEEGRPQFGRGGNAGGDRPSPEEMRARREKRNADILAVLTPEQKTAWEGMQGAKFTFPERNFGGGRNRGGNQRPAAE
jgi:Spy/CpxP family protein refolding chaperone